MGGPGWISIRYKGVYYSLFTWSVPFELFGVRLVKLLAQYPDPQYWISLVENAAVGSITQMSHPADILEAIRKRIVVDDNRIWARELYRKGCFRSVNEASEAMHDPDKFLANCRGEKSRHWSFTVGSNPTLYHLYLEHGVLLVTQNPGTVPPELNFRRTEYIYTIDLDKSALFVTSSGCTVKPGLHFKLGSIPAGLRWLRILQLSRDWVSVCYAYTPAVKKLLLERLGEDDVVSLIFDKMSAPFGSVRGCFQYLETVQAFCFKAFRFKEQKELLMIRREKVPYVLGLLLEVYSIPFPRYGPVECGGKWRTR